MNNSEIILYTTPAGTVKVEVILQDETVWLTQKAMSELFGVVKSTISEHLSNIYESDELQKEATVRKIRTVQNEAGREVNQRSRQSLPKSVAVRTNGNRQKHGYPTLGSIKKVFRSAMGIQRKTFSISLSAAISAGPPS